MLDIALNHKEELIQKMNNTWFDDKYKYYHGCYYESLCIYDDTLDGHQFVSVDTNGNVIGFISYKISRNTNNVYDLAIINFSNNKITFGIDIGKAINDIFEKYKFNKINFFVVVGNPIEKSYDKIINNYRGRIVGIYKNHFKLVDGELYDCKEYEIMRDDYMLSKVIRKIAKFNSDKSKNNEVN